MNVTVEVRYEKKSRRYPVYVSRKQRTRNSGFDSHKVYDFQLCRGMIFIFHSYDFFLATGLLTSVFTHSEVIFTTWF